MRWSVVLGKNNVPTLLNSVEESRRAWRDTVLNAGTALVPQERQHAPRQEPARTGLAASVLEKFGRQRPVMEQPRAAELIHVPMLCANTSRPFTVTLGKDRLGEPYHILSLEPAEDYLKLLRADGFRVSALGKGKVLVPHTDWTGFQCYHCGAGRCAGHMHDWFWHESCKTIFCGGRLESIYGGITKCYCPGCKGWHVIGPGVTESIGGAFYLADGR